MARPAVHTCPSIHPSIQCSTVVLTMHGWKTGISKDHRYYQLSVQKKKSFVTQSQGRSAISRRSYRIHVSGGEGNFNLEIGVKRSVFFVFLIFPCLCMYLLQLIYLVSIWKLISLTS